MSDAGRKSWTDKTKEAMVPDSAKSTQDKVKEAGTDTTDKVFREAQPDHDKSAGQEFTDKLGRSHDREAHGGSGGSILDKTKNALGLGDKH